MKKILKTAALLAALPLLAGCHFPPQGGPPLGSGGGMAPVADCGFCAGGGDKVYFAFDSSKLSAEAEGTLTKQAAWLGRNPGANVQVAGNTDDRGTEDYNLALGSRRANAARDFLVNHGVDAGRISVISYGKDHPTALGDNEESWAQNRNATTSQR